MRAVMVIAVILCVITIASAHTLQDPEAELHDHPAFSVPEQLATASLYIIGIAALIALVLIVVSIALQDHLGDKKVWMFLAIITPLLLATLFLLGATFYKNLLSDTKGPIHWHADFQIYKCGEKLDLQDPTGLLNRIGTPSVHEHGDNRIHLEGVLMEYEDGDLESFFHALGGSFTPGSLTLPTTRGWETLTEGMTCAGEPADLQVFLWQSDRETVTQRKLTDEEAPAYLISPYAYVPPGDCLIFELGPTKERTDHLCETYAVEMREGDGDGR